MTVGIGYEIRPGGEPERRALIDQRRMTSKIISATGQTFAAIQSDIAALQNDIAETQRWQKLLATPPKAVEYSFSTGQDITVTANGTSATVPNFPTLTISEPPDIPSNVTFVHYRVECRGWAIVPSGSVLYYTVEFVSSTGVFANLRQQGRVAQTIYRETSGVVDFVLLPSGPGATWDGTSEGNIVLRAWKAGTANPELRYAHRMDAYLTGVSTT